jgi:hypothetical protein
LHRGSAHYHHDRVSDSGQPDRAASTMLAFYLRYSCDVRT